MLTLSKFSRGRSAYFLATTKGDLPDVHRLIEPDGVWIGDGFAGLAVTDLAADHHTLEALFDGRDPHDASVLNPYHHRVKVAGFDCMISAPKSVSLLHALCAPHRAQVIERAHLRSVELAIGYFEHESAYVSRRVARQRVPVKIKGFIGCAFVHRTSRSLNPHLHSHVLIVNLGRDDEGRWSALDGRSLYLEMQTARALYDAQLRFALSSHLGVRWSRSPTGFTDVLGLPRRAIEAFSQRTVAISAELERRERGKSFNVVVAHRTRPEKRLDISYEALVMGWRERAFRSGLSGAHLEGLFGDQRAISADLTSLDASAIDGAADSFDRPFSRSELLGALARCSTSSTVAELERSLDEAVSSGSVIVGAHRTMMHGSRGRLTSMPLGRITALYTTENQQERRRHASSVVEHAAVIRLPAIDQRRLVHVDASVDVVGATLMKIESGQLFGREHVVCALAERCGLSHREIVAVCPNSRKAAHFEAMTGVAAATKDEVSFGPKAVVIVEGFDPAGLAAIDDVFRRAERLSCTVVRIESKRAVHPDLGLIRKDAVAAFSEMVMAGDVCVEFFRTPEGLVPCINRLARDLEARETEVCVVIEDPTLVNLLGDRATRASLLERSFVRDPHHHFVVVGGARLFGSLLPDVADTRRTHVAMWREAPGSDINERAMELAEPVFLRKALGRVPIRPAERKSWAMDAMTICREHRLRSLADRFTRSLQNPGNRLQGEVSVSQARETRFLSRNVG